MPTKAGPTVGIEQSARVMSALRQVEGVMLSDAS